MGDLDLARRAFRVAVSGVVPDDDPHVIADMQDALDKRDKRIADLEVENKNLRELCERWVPTWLPDKTALAKGGTG